MSNNDIMINFQPQLLSILGTGSLFQCSETCFLFDKDL
jgi:hypothetical protein